MCKYLDVFPSVCAIILAVVGKEMNVFPGLDISLTLDRTADGEEYGWATVISCYRYHKSSWHGKNLHSDPC